MERARVDHPGIIQIDALQPERLRAPRHVRFFEADEASDRLEVREGDRPAGPRRLLQVPDAAPHSSPPIQMLIGKSRSQSVSQA